MKNATITLAKCCTMLVCVWLSAVAMATPPGQIKDKDQTLMIITDERGCATDVVLSASEDNCAGSQFANNCGRNGKDCVCIRKDKFLNWRIDRQARFELKFTTANPLKPQCRLKSGSNHKIKCKVEAREGDFEYDVYVDGCPDAPYDPKIIVRY